MNVGIVGCGFVAKYNVDAWRRLGAEVSALCDINPESLSKAKKTYGVKNGYTDYKNMLQNEYLDAVSVCTIPQTHAEIALACIDKGCLVAVEKPFATSSEQAKPFRHNRKVLVFHNQIYEDKYYALTSYYRKHHLQAYHVDVSLMAPVTESMTADLNHWSYKLKGGRIAECMPHPVYTSQAFLGNDLNVELVHGTRFTDRPTYNDLNVKLSSPNGTANLHVKLDAAKDTNTIVAYTPKAVLTAGLNPGFVNAYNYLGESIPKIQIDKQFSRAILAYKKMLSPAKHYGSKLVPKLKGGKFFSSRYVMLKEFLGDKHICDGEHAYHNMRVIEEVISRLEVRN